MKNKRVWNIPICLKFYFDLYLPQAYFSQRTSKQTPLNDIGLLHSDSIEDAAATLFNGNTPTNVVNSTPEELPKDNKKSTSTDKTQTSPQIN